MILSIASDRTREKPQPKPLPELDQAIGHNVLHQAPTPQIDLERSVRPSWVDRVLNMVTPSRPAPQQRYLPQPQQIQAQVQAQQMQHITTPFQTTAPNTILRPQTVRRELYNPLATPLPPVTPYTQNKLTF